MSEQNRPHQPYPNLPASPSHAEDAGPLHPLRSTFRKSLRSAVKRVEKKLEKLGEELADCARAQDYLECGELIKAHIGLIPRRAEQVELPDLYHPGQTRIVELDPMLKPMDNARKYFKKQHKLQAGEAIIAEQINLGRVELEGLLRISDKYRMWEENADPALPPADELVREAAGLKIHIEGLEPVKTPQEVKHAAPSGVRVFTSHDGFTIYVGKNAQDNDNLSIRIARGNDWWLHVAHLQGSHVVVRGDGRLRGEDPLPQETLLDAAHLAAYFSKARNATRPEIHYCQAKNIRKAKGSPAGQVIVNNGKTLALRVEENRLKRLLKGVHEADRGQGD